MNRGFWTVFNKKICHLLRIYVHDEDFDQNIEQKLHILAILDVRSKVGYESESQLSSVGVQSLQAISLPVFGCIRSGNTFEHTFQKSF